jgi:pimeloyl-ACP methyl ester carboxylesterase
MHFPNSGDDRTARFGVKENDVTTSQDAAQPDTIVLIHGLWLTGKSWEHWVSRFQGRGFRVIAESWPGMEDVERIREDPTPIEHLGVTEIVDHYDGIIRGLPTPPIIMGHSFGGAFTELLLDRGLGAAGVAIDAAAVRGILTLPLSTLRSGLPVLKNPANRHRAVSLTADEFHYSFGNTLSPDESLAMFERYAVPGPGRVLFQGALANFNPRSALKLDFRNDERAPLLLIAGGSDHVVPPAIDSSAARQYSKSKAVTEYREFPGRSHLTVLERGWEEIADFALDWALQASRVPVGQV